MDHEYDHHRKHSPAAAKNRNNTAEPGQSSRSILLRRPEQPIASGLVQRRANAAGEAEPSAVHAAAARGVETASSQLPHLDTIQRAFGHHDISSVQAHTGAEADASARAMSAQAYATGKHVVLGDKADLHTVAHEAAHVVQQRAGVQLKGGVGAVGDPYERHADAVADMVVQGKSAEVLLDGFGGGGEASSAGASHVQQVSSGVVQRVEKIEWNDRVSKTAPGTASKAKLGIALIETLKDRGIAAHLGGSLVAAVFGAPRVPGDIDLEIPGKPENMTAAMEVFHSLVNRKNFFVVNGKDIFFIVGWKKASGVYELTYRHAVTERALDPLEDDEEDFDNALTKASPATEAKVDFSSESVFESDMNTQTSPLKDTEAPVYEPAFLIASYLNRLAANASEGKEDEKADRAQIIALLNYHIKSLPTERRPKSKFDIATLVKDSIVKSHIKDSNKHSKEINELVDEIASAVAGSLAT